MNKISAGKVRDIYDAGDDRLLIVVSDRISAGDVIMPDPIPDKGKLLNRLSLFWFDYTSNIVKNHLVSADIADYPKELRADEFRGRSMLVRKLKILPVECIVRGYITGSAYADYQKTGAVCGLKLPGGLREADKLPEPIFTPSTKAELGEHDENISFGECVNLLGSELAERVRDASVSLYKKCAEYAESRGIIIADTKFEFGLDGGGELILGDEVLTPDSSRFWAADAYVPGQPQDSFDKQFLRDWLSANGLRGKAPDALPAEVIATTRHKYAEAFERITGQKFEASV
ncbi:MAG: phosphoribosylaminoimidazolesuccinocarboxamide synthase [Oscillospiraceae bacterium]|jgi:phosphoribosylaminoimidazole-succinocarboxamide synthase|nr:phosphoribosylaminoimidazolesuccinocarboxamide synthase [Oscillospiraceae bacterium]